MQPKFLHTFLTDLMSKTIPRMFDDVRAQILRTMVDEDLVCSLVQK